VSGDDDGPDLSSVPFEVPRPGGALKKKEIVAVAG